MCLRVAYCSGLPALHRSWTTSLTHLVMSETMRTGGRNEPARFVRFGSLADTDEGYQGCPLYPTKQTCSAPASMSAKCHKRTFFLARRSLHASKIRRGSWFFGRV